MTETMLDVIKCESCRAPMLTYYTGDRLVFYVCPSCVDWSYSEMTTKPGLFFVS